MASKHCASACSGFLVACLLQIFIFFGLDDLPSLSSSSASHHLRTNTPHPIYSNVGKDGDVAFFIGLSGIRKTTISIDHHMNLIGDFEHCWSLHCISEYTVEMKKGLFDLMHYHMRKRQILSFHSSCNMGKDGDVAFFFGLSGTEKITLSTDHHMNLIRDVEHCWSENGLSNIEGGCYAKCIDLS
ncbi:hypothetical protein QYF36_021299 [Acer negundo]|nr:hypothetical protein QYF36_021299 [Acer negundo]